MFDQLKQLAFAAPWWLWLLGLALCLTGSFALAGKGRAGRALSWVLAGLTFVGAIAFSVVVIIDMGWNLGFDSPWWLLLLLLIPVIWAFSYRSLAGLGRFRRPFAIGLRSLVLLLLVLCLAEAQLLKTSEKLTVMYLLDQSESVPLPRREAMMSYVIREVAKHRNPDREDAAGVIIFGREAKIESAPLSDDIPSVGKIEGLVDLRVDATNLEAALKLAQATFPEDTAKRVVIVTDGNENIGNAREVARLLTDKSIAIDVVPILLDARAEVAVEKVAMPVEVRKDQPLETRVVVNNYAGQTAEDGGMVRGRLKLTRRLGASDETLSEQEVDLSPGKNVFRFRHEIAESGVYTYQADFTPTDADDDLLTQNNRATAFTQVRGQGRVLLIEDWANRGRFDYLASRLRQNGIDVTIQGSDQLFTSLAELQGFDSVILADVPRSSGEDAGNVTNFSDEQIEMLVRNTETGCGLIMVGGESSFGAGGWSNTELEKAMPVDFQIKNAKIQAVGALVLMMHASEMAEGNYWQKVTAREAIKALGPMDYAGLIHWGPAGTDQWLWGAPQGLVRVSNRRQTMLARLDRMQPGDMPQFDPAMRMTLAAFNRVNASIKHAIIISDGDPSQPRQSTLNGFVAGKIKISTVAVGAHGAAGHKTLQSIATQTGGKYYVVTNPKALPRIYQREARRVARPLIYEPDGGVTPQIVYPHEMLNGIEGAMPPIKGFVLTTVKENPLVEVSIRSPKPADNVNNTILASWTYGVGRAVAFTSDAGVKWTDTWTGWENYDKFWSQMVRWSMRPSGDQGKFTVSTDYKDGKVQVVVTALDKNDEFLNFLDLSATIIGPDLKTFELDINQTAPGRYVGEFDAPADGNYFVNITAPGDPNAEDPRPSMLMAGVNVPYSQEYRDRESNLALVTALARMTPKDGEPGLIIQGEMAPGKMDQLLEADTFRHNLPKARSSQDVWPLLVLVAACLFFFDVAVRRIQFGLEWARPAVNWVREKVFHREKLEAPDDRLERLRQRKAAVSTSLDERRAAARFEPQPDEQAVDLDRVVEEVSGARPDAPPPRAAPTPTPSSEEEDSYTSRLMKAKQQAFKKKD